MTPEEEDADAAAEASEAEAEPEPPPQQRCSACRKLFPANFKFCPHCGLSTKDLARYQRERKGRSEEAKLVDSAWKQARRVVFFYSALLFCNFLAAYILAAADCPFVLADGVIIVITGYWIYKERKLVANRLNLGSWPLALPLAFLAGGLTFAFTLLTNHIADVMLGLSELRERTGGTDLFKEEAQPLWVLVLSICVVPGIFEELFFRGLVQGVLERLLRKREAWIVQAVIFAIAHVNLLGFFTYLVFMGLWLGWLRNRTGSLLPGMLAHFCHNLCCVLADHYHWFGQ